MSNKTPSAHKALAMVANADFKPLRPEYEIYVGRDNPGSHIAMHTDSDGAEWHLVVGYDESGCVVVSLLDDDGENFEFRLVPYN